MDLRGFSPGRAGGAGASERGDGRFPPVFSKNCCKKQAVMAHILEISSFQLN